MSYNVSTLTGYGFDVSNIRWKVSEIAKFCSDLEEDEVVEDNAALNDYLFSTSQFIEVFDNGILNETDWLHYKESDDCGYIMIENAIPWDIPEDAPKSETEAINRMWDIISPYVADDFSIDEFMSVTGIIEDSVSG